MIWLDDATAAGNQTVDAGAGDDVIHGLTTLTDADVINGGAGADTLTIGVAEAGYAGTGIAFNGNLTNVETIDLVAGLDATTTAPGTANTYAFPFVDANIAAGGTLTVDGSDLRADAVIGFGGDGVLGGGGDVPTYEWMGVNGTALTEGHAVHAPGGERKSGGGERRRA